MTKLQVRPDALVTPAGPAGVACVLVFHASRISRTQRLLLADWLSLAVRDRCKYVHFHSSFSRLGSPPCGTQHASAVMARLLIEQALPTICVAVGAVDLRSTCKSLAPTQGIKDELAGTGRPARRRPLTDISNKANTDRLFAQTLPQVCNDTRPCSCGRCSLA